LKRSKTLWFDTHSQYYPFNGELLPLEDLDYDIHQQYWLPLFAALTALYSLLGVIGGWLLWRSRDHDARRWLLLAALLIFLRLGFFATLENPEPRYTVEIFPFLMILAGVGASTLKGLAKATEKAMVTGDSDSDVVAPMAEGSPD
jgi:4-amino-4-deoxy-L-arabinose transferase-like glycosyltransferase